MVMLLMGLAIAMLGFVVCAALLNAASQQAPPQDAAPTAARLQERPQFFVQAPPAEPRSAEPEMSVDMLVAQLERHIRLEQAAAESFVHTPTAASLHGRTASSLMH